MDSVGINISLLTTINYFSIQICLSERICIFNTFMYSYFDFVQMGRIDALEFMCASVCVRLLICHRAWR